MEAKQTRAAAVPDEAEETSAVYEVPPAAITQVERNLDVLRMRARAHCEPGLLRHVEDKQLSPDKQDAKMRAYGEVLAMLTRGELRHDDLHAIKVDWCDALAHVGGWERG